MLTGLRGDIGGEEEDVKESGGSREGKLLFLASLLALVCPESEGSEGRGILDPEVLFEGSRLLVRVFRWRFRLLTRGGLTVCEVAGQCSEIDNEKF